MAWNVERFMRGWRVTSDDCRGPEFDDLRRWLRQHAEQIRKQYGLPGSYVLGVLVHMTKEGFTAEQIYEMSDFDLLHYPNFGRKSLDAWKNGIKDLWNRQSAEEIMSDNETV